MTSCSRSPSPWTPRTRAPAPAVSARRRRVASASALGSTTVTSGPGGARGTANMPLPPPTSSTRNELPAPTRGSSAAQTAAVRAGNCSAVGEAGVVGTPRSLVAGPPGDRPAASDAHAVGGPPDLGDVDLLHSQHGLGGPLGAAGVGVLQKREHLHGGDLPGDAELVLEPAALALLAALGEPVPVVVGLLLVLAHDLEGDRLGEPELRAAVQAEVLLAVEGEADGEDVALPHRRRHVRPVAADGVDRGVREDGRVVLGGLLGLAVEPEARDLLGHCCSFTHVRRRRRLTGRPSPAPGLIGRLLRPSSEGRGVEVWEVGGECLEFVGTAAILAWEYEYDHEGPNHGRWPDPRHAASKTAARRPWRGVARMPGRIRACEL